MIGADEALHARPPASARTRRPRLHVVLREWGRIGFIGFGGPPAHIALLRGLCVKRRGWLDDREFEDAIAATNLLARTGAFEMDECRSSRGAGSGLAPTLGFPGGAVARPPSSM